MASPTFHDARLKIKRADEHIAELQARLVAFLDTDFYSLSVEKDADTGTYLLRFGVVTSVPDDIATVIGDALHNLRTVLDYVAFEIVTCAGGPTDFIKFPVRSKREEVKAALKGGEMKVAGSDIIDLILDVVQPYQGGNGDSLYVLHSLDMGDKHFKFTPVITVAALRNVTGKAGPVELDGCSFTADESGKLNVFGMPEEFTFVGYGEPVFMVVFGKGQPFEGEAIVPTLHQLSQLISGTVDAFEQAYVARG